MNEELLRRVDEKILGQDYTGQFAEDRPLDDFQNLCRSTALGRSIEFASTMRSRHSIRSFSDKPVADGMISYALRAACFAPSGANQQPWHFVVVADAEVKQKIRDGAEEEEREFYGGRASEKTLEDIAPFKTNASKPHLTDAPVLIVPFSVHTDNDGGKNHYVSQSIGISVGFLLAALHHAGLATLTHTPSPMKFLNEILERPKNERPFLVIPVGYPAEDAVIPAASVKAPLSSKVSFF